MTDFTKILDKAKELESKMKESQKKIKEIKVEGISGSNSVTVVLDGEGEMQSIKSSKVFMNILFSDFISVLISGLLFSSCEIFLI